MMMMGLTAVQSAAIPAIIVARFALRSNGKGIASDG
jgi:hypothetical protein